MSSDCTVTTNTRSRAGFGPGAMTVFAFLAAITMSASSSAPTPLYRLYQEQIGLSHVEVSVIFAAYAISQLVALLTIGSLSDHVGRRPVILGALLLNIAAMILFITAGSALGLLVARAVQGFATGAAITTLGAAILDTDRARGPVLNSITAFLGLTAGTLLAGVLVTFAPAPTELVYVVLLAVTAVEIAFLAAMPETGERRPGALASLRPQVRVPPQARAALLRITPVNVAGWALGGFYLSLMPSLVREATGHSTPLVAAVVVATLPLTGALTVIALRHLEPARLISSGISALVLGLLVTLAGVETHLVGLMLGGTFIAGTGFGATFSGILRTVLPLAGPDERAALLATYYVESFLAFSLPAVAAGAAAPAFGLAFTAHIYCMVLILLAFTSMLALRLSRQPA